MKFAQICPKQALKYKVLFLSTLNWPKHFISGKQFQKGQRLLTVIIFVVSSVSEVKKCTSKIIYAKGYTILDNFLSLPEPKRGIKPCKIKIVAKVNSPKFNNVPKSCI